MGINNWIDNAWGYDWGYYIYNIGGDNTMTLTERRAEFVYEGARIAAKAAGAPVIPAGWNYREDAFKKQFLPIFWRF